MSSTESPPNFVFNIVEYKTLYRSHRTNTHPHAFVKWLNSYEHYSLEELSLGVMLLDLV